MKRRIIASGLFSMALLGSLSADAKAPIQYHALKQEEFTPISITPNLVILEPNQVKNLPKSSKSRIDAKPKIVVKSVPKASVKIARTSHSVYGNASWYCKAGVSICHHSYPSGSMVAAACGKLRSAMGNSWRGKTVTVQHGTRAVRVKLVDWCGSRDKLIDLYWEPMRRLGGTGVLHVKVSW